MSTDMNSHQVHLVSRPRGWPTAQNFAVVGVELAPATHGQVVVRNIFISVDPYMRGRMNDVKSYSPPFAVGQVMDGGAVGVVVESLSDDLAVGDTVQHQFGWRDLVVGDAGNFRKVDASAVPASAYLGALGMTGLTAYAGLRSVASLKDGDIVFVSGAAGAVGSVAGQLARLMGAARVIGSAGSAEKVAYVTEELGFDAAFDYKDGPVLDQLTAAAPDGIDVYFDNVGGDHLEAAISLLRLHGRVAMCGAISQYNATAPVPGPANLAMLIGKRAMIRGFLVSDHFDVAADFERDVSGWLADGSLTFRETIVDGIDNAPDAFIGMLRGDNVGKMLVRIDEP
ncbi:MAG TPA: NADP-dependent oxidoreductase [Acidimicrobiales bacterium]|nr:NADP-dependent oxidoreductase [Acidimicrobiales bacterium]